jgi:biotin carboxyl carrier protein
MSYRVKFGGQVFSLIRENDQFLLNGTPVGTDVVSLGGNHYHILVGNNGYRAELVNREGKQFFWKINQVLYPIELQDHLDQMLEKLGFDSSSAKKLNELKSPMPGLVLKVLADAGSEVKTGDPLLVLESMKMENLIKSPGDGIISEIKVVVGQTVEKGSVMIKFV